MKPSAAVRWFRAPPAPLLAMKLWNPLREFRQA